nr:reverse transcriptase domain-containing protein [Tanacetum cinerariifolium]
MAKKDEEKTAFHTDERVFCYTKMPFRLNNAGSTYQRLVDTIFEEQMGRNLEACVYDMVIKSKTELKMIKEVKETLLTLRKESEQIQKNKGYSKHALTKKPESNATAKRKTCRLKQTIEKLLSRPYNQGYHKQAIKSNIKPSGSNGKIGQVGVDLEAYGIKYASKSNLKRQVLADFLADIMTKENPTQEDTNRPNDTFKEGEGKEKQETTSTKASKNLKV